MIALTGATGFVGREIRRQAQAHGLLVRGLSRGPIPDAAMVDEWKTVDVQRPILPEIFADCAAVIHCAARAHVMRETAMDPDAAYLQANRDAAINVAEAAALAGVKRMVFVSSIKVLGEQTLRGESFHVDDLLNPQDGYGVSKAAAERELRAVSARTGLQLVIVRPPLVHGPGARGNLSVLVRAVAMGLPLPLAGIQNRRSLVHVNNLADLLLLTTASPAAAGGTFHVTDGQPLSTPAMVGAIAAGLGKSPRLFRVPQGLLLRSARMIDREAMVARLLESLEVDDTTTRQVLGWQPMVTSAEGLRLMAEASRR